METHQEQHTEQFEGDTLEKQILRNEEDTFMPEQHEKNLQEADFETKDISKVLLNITEVERDVNTSSAKYETKSTKVSNDKSIWVSADERETENYGSDFETETKEIGLNLNPTKQNDNVSDIGCLSTGLSIPTCDSVPEPNTHKASSKELMGQNNETAEDVSEDTDHNKSVPELITEFEMISHGVTMIYNNLQSTESTLLSSSIETSKIDNATYTSIQTHQDTSSSAPTKGLFTTNVNDMEDHLDSSLKFAFQGQNQNTEKDYLVQKLLETNDVHVEQTVSILSLSDSHVFLEEEKMKLKIEGENNDVFEPKSDELSEVEFINLPIQDVDKISEIVLEYCTEKLSDSIEPLYNKQEDAPEPKDTQHVPIDNDNEENIRKNDVKPENQKILKDDRFLEDAVDGSNIPYAQWNKAVFTTTEGNSQLSMQERVGDQQDEAVTAVVCESDSVTGYWTSSETNNPKCGDIRISDEIELNHHEPEDSLDPEGSQLNPVFKEKSKDFSEEEDIIQKHTVVVRDEIFPEETVMTQNISIDKSIQSKYLNKEFDRNSTTGQSVLEKVDKHFSTSFEDKTEELREQIISHVLEPMVKDRENSFDTKEFENENINQKIPADEVRTQKQNVIVKDEIFPEDTFDAENAHTEQRSEAAEIQDSTPGTIAMDETGLQPIIKSQESIPVQNDSKDDEAKNDEVQNDEAQSVEIEYITTEPIIMDKVAEQSDMSVRNLQFSLEESETKRKTQEENEDILEGSVVTLENLDILDIKVQIDKRESQHIFEMSALKQIAEEENIPESMEPLYKSPEDIPDPKDVAVADIEGALGKVVEQHAAVDEHIVIMDAKLSVNNTISKHISGTSDEKQAVGNDNNSESIQPVCNEPDDAPDSQDSLFKPAAKENEEVSNKIENQYVEVRTKKHKVIIKDEIFPENTLGPQNEHPELQSGAVEIQELTSGQIVADETGQQLKPMIVTLESICVQSNSTEDDAIDSDKRASNGEDTQSSFEQKKDIFSVENTFSTISVGTSQTIVEGAETKNKTHIETEEIIEERVAMEEAVNTYEVVYENFPIQDTKHQKNETMEPLYTVPNDALNQEEKESAAELEDQYVTAEEVRTQKHKVMDNNDSFPEEKISSQNMHQVLQSEDVEIQEVTKEPIVMEETSLLNSHVKLMVPDQPDITTDSDKQDPKFENNIEDAIAKLKDLVPPTDNLNKVGPESTTTITHLYENLDKRFDPKDPAIERIVDSEESNLNTSINSVVSLIKTQYS